MSAPPSSRTRRIVLWLCVALLLAAAVFGYRYWRGQASTEAETATPSGPPASAISAISASQGDLPIRLTALGTVRALNSVEIRPRAEGELMEVAFDEGQTVEQGQLLARVDPRDYQAQLDQAQGQLRQDQAQLASARDDLSRFERLIETNYVSRQELEQQRQQVRQFEGTVASDQASLESAQVQLDYTRITAPFTGVVGIRNVDPGNIVQLGDEEPIVTLTQLDPISVIFALPSRHVSTLRGRLAQGDSPSVTATGTDGQTFSGTLVSLDSTINSATGTIRLRARLDNPDGALYPNAYVDVSLVSETIENRVIIPEPAVQTGQNGDYVYVVNDDDTVTQRDVVVAATQGTQSAIAEGIKAGDRVVVDGVDSLREGAEVRVVSDALPGESTDEPSSDPGDESSGEAGDSGDLATGGEDVSRS